MGRGAGTANTSATRALGLLASAAIVCAAIAACRLNGDTGYVEIKTVPVAALTQSPLYLDEVRLDPIRQGSALLRQPVGTLTLQAGGAGGTKAALCNVVVRKDRITSVTLSILERPPRCVCKFTGSSDAGDHTCVS